MEPFMTPAKLKQEESRQEVVERRLLKIELTRVDGPMIIRKGNTKPSAQWDIACTTIDERSLSPGELNIVGKILQDLGYKLRHTAKPEFGGLF